MNSIPNVTAPTRCSKKQTIRAAELRLRDGASQDLQLVAEHEDLKVLLLLTSVVNQQTEDPTQN
jgi:hypothetical protein